VVTCFNPSILRGSGSLEEVVGHPENCCTTTSFEFDLPLDLPFGFSLEIFIACDGALLCGLASWCVAFVPFGE